MDHPVILSLDDQKDLAFFNKLIKSGVIFKDHVPSQLDELLKIDASANRLSALKSAKYIYYPWRNVIIKILGEKYFYLLRTARNNPLYSKKLQSKLSQLVIGVAGLSVGSNIVRSLVYAGIAKLIKIADPDILETSNLNRISSNLHDLGENKSLNMARQIWDLNPYQKIELYDQGLNSQNLRQFLCQPKLDALFDEVDDLSLKVHLKLAARATKIAYLMATDNGYQAELDVERFDLKSAPNSLDQLPPLSLDHIIQALSCSEPIVMSATSEQELINSLIGPGSRRKEMQLAATMKLKGKIKGWPQLHSVAGVGASMAVFALLKLVNNQLPSGKKVISLM